MIQGMDIRVYAWIFMVVVIRPTMESPVASQSGGGLPVYKEVLHQPSIQDIAKAVQEGISKNYEQGEVRIVTSPDFTLEPYRLVAAGFGGNTRLVQLGSETYLFPLPHKEKVYDLDTIARLVELPGAFMLGSGQLPFQNVGGTPGEMVVNVRTSSMSNPKGKNGSVAQTADPKTCALNYHPLQDNRNAAIFTNLFISEGKPSQVMKVFARRRIGDYGFEESIRVALSKHFSRPVGLGGVFTVQKGTVDVYSMKSEFWTNPLSTTQEKDERHCFFNLSSVLVCPSFISSSNLNKGFRTTHSHCVNWQNKKIGHYISDSTPTSMEYLAYLVPVETAYIVDGIKMDSKAGSININTNYSLLILFFVYTLFA